MEARFVFRSERFDHSSELPPDANAGNRFYGRDVAEFLTDGLERQGYEASVLDEDWGWLVRARVVPERTLEIGVYHDIEEPGSPDEWTLIVRSRRRVLGVLPREAPLAADDAAALERVFQAAGIALTRPSDG